MDLKRRVEIIAGVMEDFVADVENDPPPECMKDWYRGRASGCKQFSEMLRDALEQTCELKDCEEQGYRYGSIVACTREHAEKVVE